MFLADLQEFPKDAPMRPQLMSVMWSKPSMPLRSMNAPKSVMFLTVPLRMSPGRHFARAACCVSRCARCFDQFAAGKNDVLAFLVDFDDLEFVGVADETAARFFGVMTSICDAGKKASTPTLTTRPPLTTDLTLPVMRAAFVADGEDFVPVLFELGFFVGEDDGAFLVFEFFDEDIDFVADFDGFEVVKFVAGDDAFAFVADVHEDFLGADFDDGAFDDFACGKASLRSASGLLPL